MAAHHLDETIDLFRLKIPRNAGWFGLARLWNGGAQVPLGSTAPKLELEQIAKMRWAGLVTRRVLRLPQAKNEARDVIGADGIEIAQTRTELWGQEPVIKPKAVIDGVRGQDAQIGLILAVKNRARRRINGCWFTRGRSVLSDQIIPESFQLISDVAASRLPGSLYNL